MLVLDRKKDERIIIDDEIKIMVTEIKGNTVQLGIEAPDDVEIVREEIYKEVKEENIEASKARVDINKVKDLKFEDGQGELDEKGRKDEDGN